MSRPIEKLPVDLYDAGIGALRALVFRISYRMSKPGQPVRYPVQWDSPKQKRFVLWKLNKEHNLPYRRTDKYRLGWKTEAIPFGLSLKNEHPAGAIGGTPFGWQSRVTRGRWPFFLQVLFEELAKFPAELSHALSVMGKESK